MASWPSTAQQGGDDECSCKAFSASPWWGVEGFLSNDAGEGGEGRKRRGGETQPDHRSQSWHFPLCTGRSKIMIVLPSLVTVICYLWFLCVFSCVILQHCAREIPFYSIQILMLSVQRCKRNGGQMGTSHLVTVMSPLHKAKIDLEVLGEGRGWINVTTLIWQALIQPNYQLYWLSHKMLT